MPRNTSGTYTLPAGNPVTSGTTISTTWANGTLGDLAAEISDSVSRSGKGSFSAAVRATDGTVAAPSYSFTNEIGSGVYRAAANDIRLAVGGVDALKLISGGVSGPLTFPNVSTAFIASTGANGSLFLQGNRNAADPAADVLIGSTAARTAGLIADFHNPINAVSKLQVDYQGLLRLATQAAAIQPASMVTAITPNAGYTAAQGLAYWKDATGIVRLKGWATSNGTGTGTAFTLPVGFRPAGQRNFVVSDTTGSGLLKCTVDVNGNVGSGVAPANGNSLVVDSVSFLAEQ